MGDWGQAGQGAAGGAAAGAAFGPWGAAIGGLAGGVMGYFGGDGGAGEHQAMIDRLARGYQGRSAPQMGPANLAGNSQLMGNRAQMIAQLEAQARGEGPSAARLQMQQAADQTRQMMASQASGAGGRGVNAGAAMRNANNAGAQVMQQNNQNMGIMRAQEQLNAMGQLGSAIGGGIQSDNQQAQFNAGSMNARDLANMQSQMQMLQLNDQSQLQALGLYKGQPGLGTSILAGGASAYPALQQMMSARQQNHGYGGAIGPQQGQPGWDQSSMGRYQEQQRQNWMHNNTPQLPTQSPGIDPNNWGGNHSWTPGQ